MGYISAAFFVPVVVCCQQTAMPLIHDSIPQIGLHLLCTVIQDSNTSLVHRQCYTQSDTLLLFSESRLDDVLVGTRCMYYRNGAVQDIRTYSHGVQVGEYRKYYPNGKLQILGHFGQAIDQHVINYDTICIVDVRPPNDLVCEVEEFHSLKEGEWKYFYADGNIYCRGQYVRNRRIGTWTIYNIDGSVAERSRW